MECVAAYSKQQVAIKQIKVVPDVLVTGGGTAGEGLMGQLTRLLPGVDLSGLVQKNSATEGIATG